jgi:hypothetical protein
VDTIEIDKESNPAAQPKKCNIPLEPTRRVAGTTVAPAPKIGTSESSFPFVAALAMARILNAAKVFEFRLAILGGILAVSSMGRITNKRN